MKIVSHILARITGNDAFFSGEMAQKILPSFAIQAGSVLITFILNLLIARLLGPSDYGIFSYISSVLILLATLSTFGLTNLLVRDMSVYKGSGQYGKIAALNKWSGWVVIATSITVALAAAFVYFKFHMLPDPDHRMLVALAMLSTPVFALLLVKQSALQGLGAIIQAQLSEKIMRPLLLLLITGILYTLSSDNLATLTFFNIVSYTLACAAALFFLKKELKPAELLPGDSAEKSLWLRQAFSLFIMAGISIISLRIDVLMLGAMRPSKEIGLYNVSSRLAELVSFSQMIMNFTLAPAIAHLYAANEKIKLQMLIRRTNRIMLLLALPVAIVLLLFREDILSLFGEEFRAAGAALLILCAGQIIGVSAGPSGYVLSMTGHQRLVTGITLISMCINIILNLVLIPWAGYVGAAWSSASSLLVWNVLLILATKIKTGISISIAG